MDINNINLRLVKNQQCEICEEWGTCYEACPTIYICRQCMDDPADVIGVLAESIANLENRLYQSLRDFRNQHTSRDTEIWPCEQVGMVYKVRSPSLVKPEFYEAHRVQSDVRFVAYLWKDGNKTTQLIGNCKYLEGVIMEII